jgi:valyl-tRNA synthetase
VKRLARADRIELTGSEPPKGAAQIVLDETTIFVPLAGVIDIAQERARLKKELDRSTAEAGKIEKKLGNEQFLAKANPEVVAEQRQKLEEAKLAVAKLTQALDRLTGL